MFKTINAIARLCAGVFILGALAACSTPQTRALLKAVPPDLAPRAELREVPYFPQDEFQCGPASMAMVLNHAGHKIEPQQLRESLYIPDRQGSLQIEMLASARRQGLLAYQLQPSLHSLLAEVNAGHAAIVLQNLSLDWYPLWHYAVVIGYDLTREEIILRSGANQRLVMPLSTFENTWARSKYWAMLALPPAQIPHTATPEAYLQSLAALAHSSKNTDLTPAHVAALQRWPHSLAVSIAAGNHAYQRGDLDAAEQIFSAATVQHPDSAAAHNNLAQTLSDRGKFDAALQAVQRALQLGGPLTPIIQQTRDEIEQKKRAAKPGSVQ